MISLLVTSKCVDRCTSLKLLSLQLSSGHLSPFLFVGCTNRINVGINIIVLTKDLNIISEGIPLGYIDLNRKPTEPCSFSCLIKESLGYVSVS
jgi:hypothetical protein